MGKGRYSGGDRREENILSRLRIGHTGHNKTMKLLSKHPTAFCDWCGESEMVEHVTMYCERNKEDRLKLLEEIKKKGAYDITLKFLINP